MKKLLYTTHNDLSVQLFDDWLVRYYDGDFDTPEAGLVYFRDPFNDPDYAVESDKIDHLIQHYTKSGAKIVDNLTSFADVMELEDKYCQAETYGALYPQTWLPSQHEFRPGKDLAKPRISQRAKDILFALDGRKLDDKWIIQELLDIQEELRVYAVYGEILDIASIKSSKASGKVKIIGTRKMTEAERDFTAKVLERCPLDVVGFDIAVLPEGSLRLIEANRSPQFLRYTERTGANLAKIISQTAMQD